MYIYKYMHTCVYMNIYTCIIIIIENMFSIQAKKLSSG